jgi:hypothetical protein
MRDLIRRVLPTLTWADLLEYVLVLVVVFILPGVMMLHTSDTGRAIVHFILAVTGHD